MTTSSSAISPVLASTLLAREHSQVRRDGSLPSWRTGVPSLDESLPASLWSGGKVIGVINTTGDSHDDRPDSGKSPVSGPTGLGSRSGPEPGPGRTSSSYLTAPGSIPEFSLITNLLIHHLVDPAHLPLNALTTKTKTNTPPQLQPTISILTPPISTLPTTSPLSPQTLSRALSHLQPSHPLDLLSRISLLQYLDIAGLMDTLAEVSVSISTQPQPSKIIALSSLTPLLTHLNQTSGRTSALAQLTAMLRVLTALTRSSPEVLVLVELDSDDPVKGVEWFFADEDGGLERTTGTGIATGLNMNTMRSAFSAPLAPHKSRTKPATSTTHSHPIVHPHPRIPNETLLRILLEGMDRIVLTHRYPFPNDDSDFDVSADTNATGAAIRRRTARGATIRECEIVEVIHDRVGGLDGIWAVR